jgi:hypothetical protein
MKVKCRKCNVEWIANEITFGDIAELQELKCGNFGYHKIVGVA